MSHGVVQGKQCGWGWWDQTPLGQGEEVGESFAPCSRAPTSPLAVTAPHPSARKRKRRLERNTDVTGRMDTTAGWRQQGWLGLLRPLGWGGIWSWIGMDTGGFSWGRHLLSHCHLPHAAAHLGAMPLSFSSSLETAQPLLPAGQSSVSPSSLPSLYPLGLSRDHEKREDTGKSDSYQEPPHCHQLPASPARTPVCPALPSAIVTDTSPHSRTLLGVLCPWMWHCGVPGEKGGPQAAVAGANLDCCPALEVSSASAAILG